MSRALQAEITRLSKVVDRIRTSERLSLDDDYKGRLSFQDLVYIESILVSRLKTLEKRCLFYEESKRRRAELRIKHGPRGKGLERAHQLLEKRDS